MKVIKRLITIIILIILIIVGTIIYQGHNMYKDALDRVPMDKQIEYIKNKENYTKLEEMPKMYKEAVVAVEDRRFYKHCGIDIISIGRAIWVDITSLELKEGGSTITQQLAKNSYFTQSRSPIRKVAEMFMAIDYEKQCSKEEILEMYLNTSYFGDGCYTVKKASNHYFDKDPIEMNDYESTMLAGIPNAPSVYAPTKNLDLAQQRQKQVIDKLVKYKYIEKEEENEILKQECKYNRVDI